MALEEDSPATGDPPVWSEKELSLGKAGAMMEHRQLDLSLRGTPTLNRYTVLGSRRCALSDLGARGTQGGGG